MRVYRQLVRTFLRSGEMEEPKQRKQKLFYTLMGTIAVLFIMLPCCLLVGYLTYALTLAMMGSAAGLLFVVHFIALFSMVFGVSVILNVFYFAGDIPFVLPLPISPAKVIAAKFTTAYINESVMQFLVLLSALAGYLTAAGGRWWEYAAALVGVVTLPVLPLAYCGIFCVVVMGLTHWLRSRSHVRRLSACLFLVFAIAAVWGLSLLKDLDMEYLTLQLSLGRVRFVNVLNVVFPGNYFFARALSEQNAVWFFLYLVITAAVLALFLLLAQLLYYRGLMGAETQGASARRNKKKARRVAAPKAPWRAYLKKELRVLVRTPAFFLNCIAVNLLWPVLIYVVYNMQSDSQLFHKYYLYYRLGNEAMQWIAVLLVISVTVLLTAANSIASSAITREGKHFYVMKYIPLSYRTQLHMKALVSILISGGFMTVYIVICSVWLKIDNITSWYYLLISLLEVVFITYFGLFLDTVNPKLAWDDELNALRGNTNVFFNMAYAMLITLVFVFLMLALYQFTKLPLWGFKLALALLLAAADAWMIRFCQKRGVENLEVL